MKKILILMACVLMATSAAWSAGDDELKQLDPKSLPPITQSIIKSYFPDAQVVSATKPKSKVRNGFNVTLDDGTELQFDKDGQWQRVYCGGEPIPSRMVNLKIMNHIQNGYPNTCVVMMEKDKKGNYQIQLSDGTMLLFDNQFRIKNE